MKETPERTALTAPEGSGGMPPRTSGSGSGSDARSGSGKRSRAAQPPATSRQPDRPDGPDVTGVVGDGSAAGTRSGADVRKRGWFWHWNNIVTQYAPLIGLKGVGLLNSYTVWTDRREESPHRGYAFPSQQSEADFYGEDRAELITINKILVALDLIEIRKEMVLRVDERGRRWKVPHNFYRVKDHGEGFTLTTGDVMRVVELAERDRTVYRYLRRMFSPKFSPIDGDNVWHHILDEIRPSDAWQRLAARTARDEDRASARSKAGHASRRAVDAPADFSVPERGDNAADVATDFDSDKDSASVGAAGGSEGRRTSVALFNRGSATTDEQVNTGFDENRDPVVAPINRAPATNVDRSNRTYYQVKTTTTTEEHDGPGIRADGLGRFESELPPGEGRAEDRAIQAFEEANARVSTPAERRLLRGLANQFEAAAAIHGSTGWHWLTSAIDDAVAAGSAFVAPRRLREILARWERDGAPVEYGPDVPGRDRQSSGGRRPVTDAPKPSHRRERERGEGTGEQTVVRPSPQVPPFTVEECGMTSRQIWSAVLGELRMSEEIGRTDVDTWLRDSMLVGRGAEVGSEAADALVIGVPHELARRRAAGRNLAALRGAVQRVTGMALPVEVVLIREWVRDRVEAEIEASESDVEDGDSRAGSA